MSSNNDSIELKSSALDTLKEIASKADVEEGFEIIRKVLREIYRAGSIGSKSLAKKLFIPIPTISAIRKELEKIDLIDRSAKGALLTEKGLKFVKEELDITYFQDLICSRCEGKTIQLPKDFDSLISKMKSFTERRPKPLTDIDQAFAKPITALRRAFLLLQNDDIEGRKIMLLGDDDFTSLAISLLNLKVNITVLDIDSRLLDIITDIAGENNYPITCIKHDLRKPIPNDLQNKFDVVMTDPPYTLPGLNLFLSRSIQSIKKELNKKIYLAHAHRAPNKLHQVQRIILDSGLAIKQLILGFNLYEGSELLGNTTFFAELVTTSEVHDSLPEEFLKNIYTGELNPTSRVYQCKNGHEITIGSTSEIKTIENLKLNGCPVCKSTESFVKIRTIKEK